MIFRSIISALALALLVPLAPHPAQAGEGVLSTSPSPAPLQRTVVELFTSQACSACTAADSLISDLARDSSLIALTLPVDYWNYTGWHDTMGLDTHSRRQQAYALVRGDHRFVTPQTIINGTHVIEGHNKQALLDAIALQQKEQTGPSVPIALRRTGDTIEIELPDADIGPDGAELWACPVKSSASVEVTSGENEGRILRYTNVVRKWIKLGEWDGKAARHRLPVMAINPEDADQLLVLLQPRPVSMPGPILGATMLPLPITDPQDAKPVSAPSALSVVPVDQHKTQSAPMPADASPASIPPEALPPTSMPAAIMTPTGPSPDALSGPGVQSGPTPGN